MDILIDILKKNALESQMDDFIGILKDEPHEYWTEEHFRKELPGKFDISIVALLKDKVAGYIIASLKEGKPHIHKLMVREDLRDKKIGTLLLSFFEKNLIRKGYSSVGLTVREDNPQAIKFYRKNMFSFAGKRIDSKDDSVLIIMNKEITKPI